MPRISRSESTSKYRPVSSFPDDPRLCLAVSGCTPSQPQPLCHTSPHRGSNLTACVKMTHSITAAPPSLSPDMPLLGSSSPSSRRRACSSVSKPFSCGSRFTLQASCRHPGSWIESKTYPPPRITKPHRGKARRKHRKKMVNINTKHQTARKASDRLWIVEGSTRGKSASVRAGSARCVWGCVTFFTRVMAAFR